MDTTTKCSACSGDGIVCKRSGHPTDHTGHCEPCGTFRPCEHTKCEACAGTGERACIECGPGVAAVGAHEGHALCAECLAFNRSKRVAWVFVRINGVAKQATAFRRAV